MRGIAKAKTGVSLKIGISAEFLGTRGAGPETLIRNQLSALASFPSPHHYYPYVAKLGELRNLIRTSPPNFHPRLVWPYSGWVRLSLSLPLQLLTHSVDLLHVQNVAPPWSPAPVVATINDIAFEKLPATYPLALRARLRIMMRATASRSIMVTTPSQSSMNDLIDLYGIPRDRLALVPPACPEGFSPQDPMEARALVRDRYGIRGPYILSVGLIEPKKNVDRLIQAFDRLAGDFPTLSLLICGARGWLSQDTQRAAVSSRWHNRIAFAGYVESATLPFIYSAASVFVSLSSYEGFGFTPIEAMACGAPVVVANRGSLPETVGEAALIVDPDNMPAIAAAIRSVLDQPSLAGDLKQRGFVRAGEFSPGAWAQRLVEVYEEAYQRANNGVWPSKLHPGGHGSG